MNRFHVTLLRPEHLREVAELEALCFGDPWSEDALKILTQAGGFGMAAITEDGRAVGYGGMLTVLDEGQITNIAVHPDFRRQGMGREILSAMIVHAQSLGVTRLSLEVRSSNVGAQTLYLQQGFEIAGTRKHFYSHPTEDGLVMVREDTPERALS